MATFDLFGVETFYIGSPLAALVPPATNLSISQATPTKITGTGYVELTPGISSLVDFEFDGRFTYRKTSRGKKSRGRSGALSGGVVNGFSIWDFDSGFGVDVTGLAVTVSAFQSASASNQALRNFERSLLSGSDEIVGSTDDGAGSSLYTYDGNDFVELYTGFNYVELGIGSDRIETYGDARTTVFGGPGADLFSPSLSGYTWIKDFEQGIDSLSLGFAPRAIYGPSTEGVMGLSLYLADGTAFARVDGATSV